MTDDPTVEHFVPHHCQPSDFVAMIVRLQRIEAGELSVGDQDWRTQSGVLWRMLHYAFYVRTPTC